MWTQLFEALLRAEEHEGEMKPIGRSKEEAGEGEEPPLPQKNHFPGHSPPQRTTWVKKSHWKRNSIIASFVLLIIIVGVYSLSQSAAGTRPIQVLNSA